MRRSIFERDQHRCLCCGSVQSLQIDHIKPRIRGGEDTVDNWQTLCCLCNVGKRAREIDFLETRSCRTVGDNYFPLLRPPLKPASFYSKDAWKQYVQRTVNLFYYCSAVESLNISDQQGQYRKVWQVILREGNNPYIIKDQLITLQRRVCWAFDCYGSQSPKQMAITLPDRITVVSAKSFKRLVIPDFSR